MRQSFFARRRRDSNPRAPEGKRISSAPRYDHFDTSPKYSALIHYTTSQTFIQVLSCILPAFFIAAGPTPGLQARRKIMFRIMKQTVLIAEQGLLTIETL